MNIRTIYSTVIFLLFVSLTFAQEISMDHAISDFNNKDYKSANEQLTKLIDLHPDNPMINYYYGAVQTEIGNYSNDNLIHLLKAYKSGIHKNVNYYLAIQNHALEDWDQASKHYRIYMLNSSNDDKESKKINALLKQSNEKINPFKSDDETQLALVSKDQITANKSKNVQISDSNTVVLSTVPAQKVEDKSSQDFPIEFTVRDDIKYTNTSFFRTKKGKELFLKAIEKEKKLNKTLEDSEDMRNNYLLSDYQSEKDSLAKKISEYERMSYNLKSEFTKIYYDAYKEEASYWEKLSPEEVQTQLERLSNEETTSPEVNKEISVNTIKEPKPNNPVKEKAVIIQKSPQQTNDLIYKIQIGAFKNNESRSFKKRYQKISMLRKIDKIVNNNGVTIYSVGNLSNLKDATEMQSQVKNEGIEDAFIVPYYKGKRITLKEAHEIEQNL